MCETAGKVSGQEGVEIGVAGGAGVQGFEPLRGTQEQPRCIVAPPFGVRDLGAEQVSLDPLRFVERPSLGGDQHLDGRACAPARCFDCAAANPRRARDCGSTLNAAARSRNAAAAAKPPRPWARLADRSSSAATSSSGRGRRLRQVPDAPIRIEIRIGRVASARWT